MTEARYMQRLFQGAPDLDECIKTALVYVLIHEHVRRNLDVAARPLHAGFSFRACPSGEGWSKKIREFVTCDVRIAAWNPCVDLCAQHFRVVAHRIGVESGEIY